MGKFLELVTTDCGWEYVKRVNCPGVVLVMVYHTDRQEYLMVEQYRPPVGCRVQEWAAGLIDKGETPKQAAVRELYEETGVKVTEDRLIDLGRIYSGVGMTDEEVNLFALEIDNSTIIDVPDVKGAEITHELKTVWKKETELYTLKAAKALSVLVRYKALKHNPSISFPD
ncbi:NUDIX hydrolase [Denitrovibrio acetiphilus DSM 12809]|uniref:NUDIX hydrolase n=1 Tax=Denitrovibrio acetiphilus (strain DSM 12809 / NBRC 114555 / N2460) TaxID=522772 RepID=D4H3Z2_DENA2|nr:NUDIX hydrolase [Denitrovibrio acetiphilus]ADD67303.1 NUDIX hydrolase [Denitrovibrio acetiphilus DSM 12809]